MVNENGQVIGTKSFTLVVIRLLGYKITVANYPNQLLVTL